MYVILEVIIKATLTLTLTLQEVITPYTCLVIG